MEQRYKAGYELQNNFQQSKITVTASERIAAAQTKTNKFILYFTRLALSLHQT